MLLVYFRFRQAVPSVWIDQLKEKGAELRVLNSPIDTTSAHGQLQLQILAAFAEFELAIQKERRREGIEAAKEKGVYVGRQPTAQKQTAKIVEMVAAGVPKLEVAKRLGIGKSSVYRITAAVGDSGRCATIEERLPY